MVRWDEAQEGSIKWILSKPAATGDFFYQESVGFGFRAGVS